MGVAVVERIIFCYDSYCFAHSYSPSFIMFILAIII